MSEYYESLDDEAKERYSRKLELAGLGLQNDPYVPANHEKFKDDMATWPPLEYDYIFGYFIRRPGVYTQEQLLSWKQLDAYNYFQNGYVRMVYIQRLRIQVHTAPSVRPGYASALKLLLMEPHRQDGMGDSLSRGDSLLCLIYVNPSSPSNPCLALHLIETRLNEHAEHNFHLHILAKF